MSSIKGFLLGVITSLLLFGAFNMTQKTATLNTPTPKVGDLNFPSKKENSALDQINEFAKLPDTRENRLRAAQLVIDAYPDQQFATAVAQRVEQVVGKDVTEQARQSFKAKTGAIKFNLLRTEFMVKVFNPAELAAFASVLSTPAGKGLVEKLPQYDEQWRQYLSPMLLEILGGQS